MPHPLQYGGKSLRISNAAKCTCRFPHGDKIPCAELGGILRLLVGIGKNPAKTRHGRPAATLAEVDCAFRSLERIGILEPCEQKLLLCI